MPTQGLQRVLLVEDDAMLRGLLTKHLRRNGYVVTEAPDAETVLNDWVDLGVYDLVLTDVHLPGQSGVELVRRLKEKDGETAPVVFVTGDADEQLARTALAQGAAGYLLKPFEFFELDALVSQVLRTAGMAMAPLQSRGVTVPREMSGRNLTHRMDEQRALQTFRIAVQRPARIVVREGRSRRRRPVIGMKAVGAVAVCVLLGWCAGRAAYSEEQAPGEGVSATAAPAPTVFFPVVIESRGPSRD